MTARPSAPDEVALEVAGLTLRGLAWGPPEGRPALLVHGWLDNAASFAALAPRLDGVRAVALDLPGHGLSDHKPPSAHYHFVDWVVDLARAADALGWGRFSLVGHSLGAAIASVFAGALPARVERLVLIEGLGPNACPVEEAPERLARAVEQASGRTRRLPRAHEDLDAAAERLRQVARGLSLEAARLLAARGTTPGPSGGLVWRSDARLRALSPLRITEEHVRAFLGRIACPALLVRAREGLAYDPETLVARAGCVRGLRVVEVDGHHHVHMDAPEAVAALAGPFLRGEAEGAEDPGDGRGPGPNGEAAAGMGFRAGSDPAAARAEAAARVRLLVLDVDGVLTDGRLDYGAEGEDRKRFPVRDGLGIKLLRRGGVSVALLSGRRGAPLEARARELGCDRVVLGVEAKLPALEALARDLQVPLEEVAYMGDDLIDLAPLRRVGLPCAPADAVPEVLALAHHVTRARGGDGAARELAEHLLRARGVWADLVADYGDGG